MDNKYEYLESLLSKIEMTQYMDLFIKNDLIEEDVIRQLSENDLEKIGITSLGNRKKILGSIMKPIETENDQQEEENTTNENETEEKKSSPWKVVGWLLVVLLIIVIIASIGI